MNRVPYSIISVFNLNTRLAVQNEVQVDDTKIDDRIIC
jgi:hypothetical protein